MRNKKCVRPTALALVLLLSACGSANGIENRADGSQTRSANEVLASEQQAAGSQKVASASSETVDVTAASRVVEGGSEAPIDLKGADGTSIDLTKPSATMVFSEAYNIMMNPDSCMSRTTRMEGLVAIYHDETRDTDYYSCIIQGTTACCTQGIGFKLADNYRFPDDYPPRGSEIAVHGRFDVYKEGEHKYTVLKDAVFEEVNIGNEDETTAP